MVTEKKDDEDEEVGVVQITHERVHHRLRSLVHSDLVKTK